jgi:hypothetical protein
MPINQLWKVLNLLFPAPCCTAELLIQYATSDADNYMGYGQLRGALSLDLLSGKATEVRPQRKQKRSAHRRAGSRGVQALHIHRQDGVNMHLPEVAMP